MAVIVRVGILFLLASSLTGGLADAASLFEDQRVPFIQQDTERGALLEASLSGAASVGRAGSLFAGQARGGLFAPIIRQAYRAPNFGVAGLKNLIAKAEAGSAQYDAVVFSARIKPPKRPTEMTIGEIYEWIKATPRQNHAIGRYQFIPDTLRMLVRRAGLDTTTQFSPDVQDALAYMLMQDAGIEAFLAGEMPRVQFMNNLAKIWAGLPNSSGKSHYEGYAGNKAIISWSTFEASMMRYFPGT